jgi:hypothetical protein
MGEKQTMSGRTGKMTKEQQAARGPQMSLREIYLDGRKVGNVISGDSWGAFNIQGGPQYSIGLLAKSYSLSYLVRIGKANR